MNKEIEREIKQEERNHHVAGVIAIVIILLIVIYLSNSDQKPAVWGDETTIIPGDIVCDGNFCIEY